MTTLHSPNLGLPYPDESSPADVPTDLGALVAALDALGNFAQPGDLKMSAAPNPTTGWLLCDGRAVSRAAYAALYAAVGDTWGPGDGSATFNLPDYRGRTLVGAGVGGGLTARALAGKGGEEAHALSLAEAPAHSHGGGTGNDSPDHTHSGYTSTDTPDHGHTNYFASGGAAYPIYNTGAGGSGQSSWNSAGSGVAVAHYREALTVGGATARHTHTVATYGASTRHTHSIPADGGNGAHNNMQPYAVANVLIKT